MPVIIAIDGKNAEKAEPSAFRGEPVQEDFFRPVAVVVPGNGW
jgi:hypothetical protein